MDRFIIRLPKFDKAIEASGASSPILGISLLEDAARAGATDIHIDPHSEGGIIRMRVNGEVTEVARVEHALSARLLNQLKADADIDPGTVFMPRAARHAYSVNGKQLDTRIMLAPCVGGQKMAIRLLDPDRVRHRVEDLGLSARGTETVRGWLEGLNGMFLVTGPTGSGKTTTLYALLHELSDHHRNILTIEDPVEYEIDGISQIQVDSRHGLTFSEGVQAILRMDPDYILVGEMREPESARVAAAAAISGHVLLSTIHARDAISTITALRNFGLTSHQIAVSLTVIVNQRLVRKLCKACRRQWEPTKRDRRWLQSVGAEIPDLAWSPGGCEECKGTGYCGRTGIFEIWHLDATDYDMLLANADERSLRQKLAQAGHETLLDHAVESIGAGVTTVSEVRRFCPTAALPPGKLPSRANDAKLRPIDA